MAELTVSNRRRNCIGNKWEDWGEVTVSSGAGWVETTLHWIEDVLISSRAGDECTGKVLKNENTDVVQEDGDVAGDPGKFFMTAFATSGTYQFIARGR